MPAPDPDIAVLVAVPTFRRATLLQALVPLLRDQAAALPGGRARVVLVDNDPDRSAAEVADRLEVGYCSEPRPGIAHVRQRALELAGPDELVVMVDDDVTPEQDWLAALVDVWRVHRPTVVMGHVRYVWPQGTDPWLVSGGFLRRNHHPTGTALRTLSTGNVLVDAAAVRVLGVGFDVSLGLAGGEDTSFGTAVLAAGGTIVAAAESVVCDVVPADRATVEFVRRRTVAHGQARALLELGGRRGGALVRARVAQLVGGWLRWVVFTAVHLVGRARSDLVRDAVGQRRAWFALGRIRGALGHRGAEYVRDDD